MTALPLPILEPGPQRPAFAEGPRSLDAIKLLRLSLTDRCNLRCVYCMPEGGVEYFDRHDLLTVEDYLAVARTACDLGVRHLKLTGGEPTLHPGLLHVVRGLAELNPADLSMTTNGLRLPALAAPLRDAGLDRLTVSLDTLSPETFTRITGGRGATLDQVWAGLDAATAAGFVRIKLNVVVLGGVNHREVADLAALTLSRPWTVRFIEYMPLGDSVAADRVAGGQAVTVDNADTRGRLEAVHGKLEPVERSGEPGVGPAEVFRIPGATGRVGFISAMSRPFCESCNRLRLTARGELRACLFDGGETDAYPVLRDPTLDEAGRRAALADLFRHCVREKPETHSDHGNRAMSQLGG